MNRIGVRQKVGKSQRVAFRQRAGQHSRRRPQAVQQGCRRGRRRSRRGGHMGRIQSLRAGDGRLNRLPRRQQHPVLHRDTHDPGIAAERDKGSVARRHAEGWNGEAAASGAAVLAQAEGNPPERQQARPEQVKRRVPQRSPVRQRVQRDGLSAEVVVGRAAVRHSRKVGLVGDDFFRRSGDARRTERVVGARQQGICGDAFLAGAAECQGLRFQCCVRFVRPNISAQVICSGRQVGTCGVRVKCQLAAISDVNILELKLRYGAGRAAN